MTARKDGIFIHLKQQIMTTSFHILGFWFHVKWKGEVGTDQSGGTWYNPEHPQPEKGELIDCLLDAKNEINKKLINHG